MRDFVRHPRATPNIERFAAAWPDEFRDGARCAFLRKREGNREPGGYPKGFFDWSLDRRDAWFAGFNLGFCDRQKVEAQHVHAA